MGTTMTIPEAISKVKATNPSFFQGVKRYSYMPYDMNFALQVVEAIGKERKPTFVIDDENRFVFENLIRWVHGDPKFKCINPVTKKVKTGNLNAGIYVAGPTGTGKSWALEIMSIYSTIDGDEGVRVFARGSTRVLQWPCFRSDEICDEYAKEGVIERYKKMSVVCFQDLATEQLETIHMGNRMNVFQQILGYRGDRTDQITLISSNLPINCEALRKRYDDRVVSRLNEMCNYFELKGKDRREL